MFKSTISPYGITLQEGGRIGTFPAAEVSFIQRAGEWLSLFLLIDSGASISALPVTDSGVFGISVKDGLEMKIYGIGQEWVGGWRHELKIRLGGNELLLPFVFLDGYNGPRILGREGVFDKFSILFTESKQRTIFIGNHSKEEFKIYKILEKSE